MACAWKPLGWHLGPELTGTSIWICFRWTPHPVIVTIRDNRDYIRVLLYSYYTTITGWGVLLRYATFHHRGGPQYRPPNTIILLIATPQKGPLVQGSLSPSNDQALRIKTDLSQTSSHIWMINPRPQVLDLVGQVGQIHSFRSHVDQGSIGIANEGT